MQPKMLFVSRHFHTAGVCIDDMRIFESVLHIINQDIIEHTCFPVFPGNFQIIILYLGIEYAFGNIQFRGFLFHRKNQGSQFSLGNRANYVLEIE